MRLTALLLALALGGAPAASRQEISAGPTARQPISDSGPAQRVGEVDLGPARRVGKADLDLNADFDEAEPPLPSERGEAAPRKPSRAWIYWTAAAGTLAAAGGLGWYWHNRTDAVRTVREEQVFTDER